MLSMQDVPCSLIARNESWVRKQASAVARRLPSNVEKADLIQVGLIAVAQAALAFEFDGDRDGEEGQQAFLRYAQMRVKGAMIDELRQMDHLGRGQRRKLRVLQIARERWRATHGGEPGLGDLSRVSGIGVDEIASLEQAAEQANAISLSEDPDDEGRQLPQPATPQDEVEARVDTAIVMRKLAKFFATLPERERQVIDAHLGIGMTPNQLASSFSVTPARVSQMYKAVCQRIAEHFGHVGHRALDRSGAGVRGPMEELIARREAQLAEADNAPGWGDLVEQAFTLPDERFGTPDEQAPAPLAVSSATRWS
jgi:RNA polymerase sigma factor for flagellar operon FliA